MSSCCVITQHTHYLGHRAILMDTSQETVPLGPLADQLALSLKMHTLRLDELRDFFRVQKIKMSIDQKTELREIIDSLSSVMSSVLLNSATHKIGEVIASKVKDELLSTCKRIENSSAEMNKQRSLPSTSSPLLRHDNQTQLPRSYSDAVRVLNKNRKIDPQRMYSGKKNIIFVKKNDKSKVSVSDINLLLKKDQDIKINRIYENPNNFKIISFDSESSEKLKCHLKDKCGFEVSEKSLFNPCVSISGVPHDISDDSFLSELCFRNGASEDDTKILKRINSRTSPTDRVIVRSTSDFRDRVMRIGRVFIGASSFRVEDFVNVLKCFKCQRYGHAAKNCSHDAACGLCSGGHITRDCPNKDQNFKCINCIRNNKPISDHSTNWRKCPFYITAIINQTESTEYAIK